MDPQSFAGKVLDDIEATVAEAWLAVEDWDYDRLRRAMADVAAHVEGWQGGPRS